MLALLIFVSLWLFFIVIVGIIQLVSNSYFAIICIILSMVCHIFTFLVIVYLYKYFFAGQSTKISYLEFSFCIYYKDKNIRSWKIYIYIPAINTFFIDEKNGNIIHLESFLNSNQYTYFMKKISSKINTMKGKSFTHICEKTYYDYDELPIDIAVVIKILKNFVEEKLILITMQEEAVIINPYLCSIKIERISVH